MNMERQMSRHLSEEHDTSLSPEKKRGITNIFNSIFDKPLNQSSHIITRDIILNGIKL